MSEGNENQELSEDELIDAALAALDQVPLPGTPTASPDTDSDPAPLTSTPPADPDLASAPVPTASEDEDLAAEGSGSLGASAEHVSPTLAGLAENRRPQTATACEHCPNSVWFASPTELKCYCRVMYLVTWSSDKPNQILLCDGLDMQ